MATEHARRFEVTPPGKGAWAFVAGIGLLLPLSIAAVLYATEVDPQALRAAQFALPAFLLVMLATVACMQRRSVGIEQHRLVVRAAFYTLRLPLDAIDLPRARVISLAEHTRLKPSLKTNSMSLPGFHAGHYLSRGKQRLFSLVTDNARVLALPESSGRMILLSLQRPQALLAAIEAARLRDRAEAIAAVRHA
jgi:hypothetical protein